LAFLVFIVTYVISMYENEKDYSWLLSSCLIGIAVGIMPYWNSVVNTALLSFLGLYTIINIRKKDVFIPMFISTAIAGLVSQFHIGYEVGRFDILDLTEFYFKVLGLKLIIIVIAFLIVPNRKKTWRGAV